MWVNKKEIPANGKDDGGNGYVDDVYGIGWTWYGKKDVGPLRKLESRLGHGPLARPMPSCFQQSRKRRRLLGR